MPWLGSAILNGFQWVSINWGPRRPKNNVTWLGPLGPQFTDTRF